MNDFDTIKKLKKRNVYGLAAISIISSILSVSIFFLDKIVSELSPIDFFQQRFLIGWHYIQPNFIVIYLLSSCLLLIFCFYTYNYMKGETNE